MENQEKDASPVEANTDPDGSVSPPAARNGSPVSWPGTLTPNLLLTVLTAVGIVCQEYEDYFLVAQLNSNNCSLLMKTETTKNLGIKQGTQFEFKFQNFEVPFKKMASKIIEILKIVENTTIWKAVNWKTFRMVQYLTQQPEEIMREQERNPTRCVVVSTYKHTIGIPPGLIATCKEISAEDFTTGAIWCTLSICDGYHNWVMDMPYDENSEKASTAPAPMKSLPLKINELQRALVLNLSTYQPDDGLSRLPGRRHQKLQKTRKPSESNFKSGDQKMKFGDIAPVGTYIPENRGHRLNEERNPYGGRGEHPGRNLDSLGSRNYRSENHIERWIREVNQSLARNHCVSAEEFPLYDGYRRAQERNFELEDLPRGESSSGAPNGTNYQGSRQLDHNSRNRGNGVSFFGRRNDLLERNSNLTRTDQHTDRVQRRNVEMDEVPREESSTAVQNGHNSQLQQNPQNRGNGVSFFGRRNYRQNEQYSDSAQGSIPFDPWNVSSWRNDNNRTVAVPNSAQEAPSNSGLQAPTNYRLQAPSNSRLQAPSNSGLQAPTNTSRRAMAPVRIDFAHPTIEDRDVKKDEKEVKSAQDVQNLWKENIRKEFYESVKNALKKEEKEVVSNTNKRECPESRNEEQNRAESSTTPSPQPTQTIPATVPGSEVEKMEDLGMIDAETAKKLMKFIVQSSEMSNSSTLLIFLSLSIFVVFLFYCFLSDLF